MLISKGCTAIQGDINENALYVQRMEMLQDIALELSGEVVFPTCIDAALRLRKELKNPELPIVRIEKMIAIEPLVITKLMKLANSSHYNIGGEPIRSLSAAINRLGIDLVRTTTLAIAIKQVLYSKELHCVKDLAHSYWTQSIKTSVAARLVAHKHTQIDPDTAFLAGLVHDLGAFYMLYRAVQYPALRACRDSVKSLVMEWHEGIGDSLLTTLGIPKEIVDATLDHHLPRPEIAKIQTLADVIYVGNILAGGHFEWFNYRMEMNSSSITSIFKSYADLIPEIETSSHEMLAVLS
jgi:HD-like signal output (HDOD) protein